MQTQQQEAELAFPQHAALYHHGLQAGDGSSGTGSGAVRGEGGLRQRRARELRASRRAVRDRALAGQALGNTSRRHRGHAGGGRRTGPQTTPGTTRRQTRAEQPEPLSGEHASPASGQSLRPSPEQRPRHTESNRAEWAAPTEPGRGAAGELPAARENLILPARFRLERRPRGLTCIPLRQPRLSPPQSRHGRAANLRPAPSGAMGGSARRLSRHWATRAESAGGSACAPFRRSGASPR